MLQTRLQSGFSSMLVSFCSSAAFSAGLRACSGPPENPQNQPQRSFPQDLHGAEGQKAKRGRKAEGREDTVGKGSDEREKGMERDGEKPKESGAQKEAEHGTIGLALSAEMGLYTELWPWSRHPNSHGAEASHYCRAGGVLRGKDSVVCSNSGHTPHMRMWGV